MEPKNLEELCADLRGSIEVLKREVSDLLQPCYYEDNSVLLKGANIPAIQEHNIKANITLVFRNLEDARMRLGKVMQATQGGVSCLDK